MAIFTLAQKVFVVKAYYKMDESFSKVMICLKRRYGQIFAENCIPEISKIVRFFEATGSVPELAKYKSIDEVEEPKTQITYQTIEDQCQEIIIHEREEDYSESLIIEDTEGLENSASPSSTGEQEDTSTNLCSECGEVVPKRMFWRHRKTHMKYPCRVCNKQLSTNHRRIEHESTHMSPEDRPKFYCEICGREFNTEKLMHRHRVVHIGGRNFECDFCHQKFRTSATLKQHKLTHTGEKPYECDVCGQRFTAYMSHQMHVRLHTGDRPYTCDFCDKKFIGGPALNVSYRLMKMNDRLKRASPFQNHLKKHHPQAYTSHCPLCDGIFKNDNALQMHMDKKHGGSSREATEMAGEDEGEDRGDPLEVQFQIEANDVDVQEIVLVE